MNKPKHHHSDRDRIYTPESVARVCVSKIPAQEKDSWCDPAYGKGVFYNLFPTENKEYYEIDLGKDFLKSTKKYDWLVTNIPFSQPKEFIFKMAENCIQGFGILCLANSMTATRLKNLSHLGLFLTDMIVIYIKQWGFGYRTDFYVFEREPAEKFEVLIE